MADYTAEEKFTELSSQFCSSYAEEKRNELEDFILDCASECGSPIERLMAAAFAYGIKSPQWFDGNGWVNNFDFCPKKPRFEEYWLEIPSHSGVEITPQMRVGKYTADFVLRVAVPGGGCAYGAVECDGHDHHNLTKKQAQHDRERDRYFQETGLLVLRYTGTEIWRSPIKCALESICVIGKRADEAPAFFWREKK